MDKTKPVFVTGGTGYVGSWVVKNLLEAGFTVNLTVRNKAKIEKYEHLLKIADESSGKLELFEADLLVDGSYMKAMKGCEVVFHMASPFMINGIKNAQTQLVDPALKGTVNILNTVNETESVKRVVLTSSVVSIYGDAKDAEKVPGGIFNEEVWNTTSSLKSKPYPYSKVLAEKEAWKICDAQSRWDMVVINPGFVMGPSLTANSDSASIGFMLDMVNGKNKMGVPVLEFGMVDVRDIAKAHIKGANLEKANGRNILVNSSITMLEFANILRDKYGDTYPLPKSLLPKFMLYLVGWTQGISWDFVSKNIGYPLKFDNSKSKKELGMEYIPIEKTLTDHLEQLKAFNLVKTVE
jgi:nucleoside-diphosphate-sugar epimerase